MIVLFCNDDISEFLSLATEEGWISEFWELDFLRRAFPIGCLVYRNKGIPVAFLTSIKYERSGWIGNLLVRKEWRGQGLGSALFQRALELLDEAGARTVWLTASISGRPIYERQRFIAIDTINRWQARGRIVSSNHTTEGFAEILTLDEAGWGDSREALLRATVDRGSCSLLPDGFMVHQGRKECHYDWSMGEPKSGIGSKAFGAEHDSGEKRFSDISRRSVEKQRCVETADQDRIHRTIFHHTHVPGRRARLFPRKHLRPCKYGKHGVRKAA